MERLENVDMGKYTSFRTGGRAAEMAVPENAEELLQLMREIHDQDRNYIVLGNGSNTLVLDTGFHGIVVKLGKAFSQIRRQGERLICGSGVFLSAAAREAQASGLTGLEFASGIPGSVGGAVFMNAGAYGGEMKDVVEEAVVVRRNGSGTATLTGEELEFAYRHSVLEKTGDIVISVTLKLQPGDPQQIAAQMAELTRRRNEKQPVQYPSCGSFFKRPEGYFAGKLIQDAGLKGLTVGGAQVSTLHSGFIINRGGASAADIVDLMRLVQNTVFDKFGVRLEPEVRIIGD